RRAAGCGPVRQCWSQLHGPAEVGLRLAEDVLVALFGCDGGGLEAGRSPTDDEHPAACSHTRPGQKGQLPTGLGVLDARDRNPGLEVSDARLVAADAGADLVDGIALRLAGDVRVADHRAGHDRHARPTLSARGF